MRQFTRYGRQIKITKLTKERTIQHLLNVCFAVINVLNFALPAKTKIRLSNINCSLKSFNFRGFSHQQPLALIGLSEYSISNFSQLFIRNFLASFNSANLRPKIRWVNLNDFTKNKLPLSQTTLFQPNTAAWSAGQNRQFLLSVNCLSSSFSRFLKHPTSAETCAALPTNSRCLKIHPG